MNRSLFSVPLLLSILIFGLISCTPQRRVSPGHAADKQTFSTPEEALAEFKSALLAEDTERLVALLGERRRSLIVTGDPTADALFLRRLGQRFKERAEVHPAVTIDHKGEQWYTIRYGIEGWDMHMPLVNSGKGWFFAPDYATKKDLRIRRNFNETTAVDTCLAIAKAQNNYKSQDWDNDGVLEYAQKFISSPGKKDGLYWPPEANGPKSPLDGIVARAMHDGYKAGTPSYEGYVYKIMNAQGRDAVGGARSFLVDGNLVGGFALLAYPIRYKESGDMTFVLGVDGQKVYMKDLGVRTNSIASELKEVNPDRTWALADWYGADSRRAW